MSSIYGDFFSEQTNSKKKITVNFEFAPNSLIDSDQSQLEDENIEKAVNDFINKLKSITKAKDPNYNWNLKE